MSVTYKTAESVCEEHFTGYNTWADSLSLKEDIHLEEVVKKYAD